MQTFYLYSWLHHHDSEGCNISPRVISIILIKVFYYLDRGYFTTSKDSTAKGSFVCKPPPELSTQNLEKAALFGFGTWENWKKPPLGFH